MFVVEYDFTTCEGRGRDYVNSIEEVLEKLNYHNERNARAFILKPIKIQVNYTEENS
jgi:hypothetical protein